MAGNWKMNLLAADVAPYAAVLRANETAGEAKTIVCVPYLSIPAAVEAFKGSSVAVGAQDVSEEASGARTGEVSAAQLREAGVTYVIVGHSERRQYHGETDAIVAKKLKAVLEAGMLPILCVGETLSERESGIAAERIRIQLKAALLGVSVESMRKLTVAYEPVWAIGTGKTASAEQAQEICALIRAQLSELYGKAAAQGCSVLYGGSMKPGNAAELLAQPDIDGGLVGGASLKAEQFQTMIQAANA